MSLACPLFPDARKIDRRDALDLAVFSKQAGPPVTQPVAACIESHYKRSWNNLPLVRRCPYSPTTDPPASFHVLEFPPTATRSLWTYATCGMAEAGDRSLLELHLFSPGECDAHVELLTAVAHYHRTGAVLGLNHIVNFGRPWMPGSSCDHGLISLPYLDGPELEDCRMPDGTAIAKCLWLLPITAAERLFILANGIEAFEQRFENAQANYVDPHRQSVV